ncbi:hypothetical protein H696_03998 [Fonticula alba]|uniref:MCM N-terminal domain-containing protein n=1 Tax=Fonticula alba TaxID=691883 RepID=A0A058Z639_FONAL|nr:hypothetical protein H696_03998 [Fonticula alba]KCV69576.1 hypothetical protein H696_03998 [Fonticula alba]|eukprot:XP_009496141.1 hypothetical protein H696_03998 [Fonticula alba]
MSTFLSTSSAVASGDVDIDTLVVRLYAQFLDSTDLSVNYRDLVAQMINKRQTRLIVNIDDLRAFNAAEAKILLKNPSLRLIAFEQALREMVESINHLYARETEGQLRIGITGPLGAHSLNPRMLAAHYLGSLVSIEGIVTRWESRGFGGASDPFSGSPGHLIARMPGAERRAAPRGTNSGGCRRCKMAPPV